MDNDLFSNSDDELDGHTIERSKLVISAPEGPLSEEATSSEVELNDPLPQNDGVQDRGTVINKFIKIFIRTYAKRGEGINAYIVYKIETKVLNIPGYVKDSFEVWRRFSDFLGLHDRLIENYQSKGIMVPYPPQKSISSLTKTKLSAGDENNTNDFAEKRCRLLERFLIRVVSHPRLISDCDVRDFLTFDGPLPKAVSTSVLSSSNMKKMFRSLGDSFSKLASPMDENDRWFEQIHGHVDELDEIFGRLHSFSQSLYNHRRDLSLSEEQLSKAISMLASCEENTALARILSKLAEIHENIAIVEKNESYDDWQQLTEEFNEQLQLIYVLKEALFERVKGWQNWKNQQQLLTKKREIKTRLDLAGKTDKSSQYKEELKEQELNADKMEKEFLDTSKTIRDEFNRYRKQCHDDLKNSMIVYLESLIKNEEQTLEYWEKFERETKNL